MPLESHFDFSFSQDFYYNEKSGGKITFMWTIMNVANLFNKNWGKYYENVYAFAPLTVQGYTETPEGDYVPTFSYYENYKDLNDYFSRWRMQFGIRITF